VEQLSMKDTVQNSRTWSAKGGDSIHQARYSQSINSNAELLDTALARIARLEAVLAITGGSIHDVNNLLTILAGDLYLLTESVRQDPAMFLKVRSARNTVDRASTLMRELLTFARDPIDEAPTICPANHVLALEPLLRRSFSAGQALAVNHGESPWSVATSAAQFESAVTNLVLNARDSIGATGVVRVDVDNHPCNGKVVGDRLSPGDYVCVRVTDNGIGIPEKLLARITEPLVTSKASGHGNGLGLGMVNRFCTNAGGLMTIESIVGSGTTVRIWLPRDKDAAEITANMTLPLSTLPGGDETVFLALDDTEVRSTLQQILEAVGYRVIVYDDRQPAPISSANKLRPVVILCNRSTENALQERKWLDALRQNYPSIRQVAILATGAKSSAAADADAILYRPIGVQDLTRALRSALEHKP
jgi:signal transduction histidine kinase/CheY-like chemotaxis protein